MEEKKPLDNIDNTAPMPENQETQEEQASKQPPEKPLEDAPKKKGLRAWWAKHKPTKRRLIQVYAALLFNANIKGFITGEIFTGQSKYLCVPGLNCYSCPGAVGACPLGAFQNALAESNTRAPYYLLGIIILFGIIFARTICGFLCPVGLGQELLYKIKTPKIKKNRVTYVLSYFKYVLLAVFVIAIPILYSYQNTAVPGFCKYVCPAGTFGGAIALLIHPDNASMFGMLGPLFTWKMIVLVAIVALSIFAYRAFCRFFCPLGAIYGFFNKIALIGVKLDKNSCTDCGLCIAHCKMDIRKVGDHECINCGECIDVCPAKAITWKGSKVFLHKNAVESAAVPAEKPLNAAFLANNAAIAHSATDAPIKQNEATVSEIAPMQEKKKKFTLRGKGKEFWLRVGACVVAAVVFVGVFVYSNFIAGGKPRASARYLYSVTTKDESAGLLSFSITKENGSSEAVIPQSGAGTEEDPYVVTEIAGKYAIPVQVVGGETTRVWFTYTFTEKVTAYEIAGENVRIEIFYAPQSATPRLFYDNANGENKFSLTGNGASALQGNTVGSECYEFSLQGYNGEESVALSDYRGKIVVINFWGTWCGPCVAELPEFQQLLDRYSDRVEVIAIHSYYRPRNVQEFLDNNPDRLNANRKWKDWDVHFAQDTGSDEVSDVYALLGGKNGAYPRTLILDKEGVISCVFDGSTNYEELKAEVDKLLAE